MNTQDTSAFFFKSYRAAFSRLNAEAIADHFTCPLQITGEAREVSVSSVEERSAWTASLHRVLDMYRALAIADAQFRLLGQIQLSDRLRTAHLNWTLYDQAGDSLYEFSAVYTVARIGEPLLITAIAHDEISQYRAWLQQRQISRSSPPA